MARHMAIYRADKQHGVAWITGGGTGMGYQLALDLARDGWTVAVTSLTENPVEPGAEIETPGLPGKILQYHCDVTDEAAMAAVVEAIERQTGPIVLAVFNAGIYIPVHGQALAIADFRRTYEVNLFGVLNGLAPVVPRMQERGRGHVVINASVSSYLGWPSAAAYGSSKAALNNMAESLRYDFERMNIRIQVVNPGFVDTPLIENINYRMPALVPVEQAGAHLARAIRSGGYETAFPRRLAWTLKFLRLWPRDLAFAFMKYATRKLRRSPIPGASRTRSARRRPG